MYDNKLFRCHSEVYHNAKLKMYPDGNHKLTVASRPIFKEEGWESTEFKEPVPKPKNMCNEVREDSFRRALNTVYDIARLNHFRWFITWTLDKSLIDRYDPVQVSRKLQDYLKNKVRRNAAVYLVIPEHHKDGAIHMHGLLNGEFSMVDSGKQTKGGQRIYNMPQWKFGYSTAIELDEQKQRVANYITKYISKDFRKIFGNFYYAGGKELIRKPPTQLYDINYYDVNAKEYTIQQAGLGFKYAELGDNASDSESNTQAILDLLFGV